MGLVLSLKFLAVLDKVTEYFFEVGVLGIDDGVDVRRRLTAGDSLDCCSDVVE